MRRRIDIRVSDLEDLMREFQHRRATPSGVVLKIETKAAFDQLPALLLIAMQGPPLGVMVARGDMLLRFHREAGQRALYSHKCGVDPHLRDG